jgi:hypothetical protein
MLQAFRQRSPLKLKRRMLTFVFVLVLTMIRSLMSSLHSDFIRRTEEAIRQLAGIVKETLAPIALRRRFSTVLPFRSPYVDIINLPFPIIAINSAKVWNR